MSATVEDVTRVPVDTERLEAVLLIEGVMELYQSVNHQDLTLPSALAHAKDRATGLVDNRNLHANAARMAREARDQAHQRGKAILNIEPYAFARHTAAFCIANAVLEVNLDRPRLDVVHSSVHMAEAFYKLGGVHA